MHPATSINGNGTSRGGSFGNISFPAVGLSVIGAILLATRFYFVRELVIFLAALAVLFAFATGAVLLLILLQEVERWSARQIIEAKQRIILLRTASIFQSSKLDH